MLLAKDVCVLLVELLSGFAYVLLPQLGVDTLVYGLNLCLDTRVRQDQLLVIAERYSSRHQFFRDVVGDA
jgi:hypothetical protein